MAQVKCGFQVLILRDENGNSYSIQPRLEEANLSDFIILIGCCERAKQFFIDEMKKLEDAHRKMNDEPMPQAEIKLWPDRKAEAEWVKEHRPDFEHFGIEKRPDGAPRCCNICGRELPIKRKDILNSICDGCLEKMPKFKNNNGGETQ